MKRLLKYAIHTLSLVALAVLVFSTGITEKILSRDEGDANKKLPEGGLFSAFAVTSARADAPAPSDGGVSGDAGVGSGGSSADGAGCSSCGASSGSAGAGADGGDGGCGGSSGDGGSGGDGGSSGSK